MASSMSCRSPQAEQVFWRIKRSFPSKTPSALASRGRTIAVPPLVCRFLAEAALRSADTPLRDNGRTRHTPTAQNAFQRAAPGCIRLTPSAFLHRPKALCRRGIRVLLPFVTVTVLQMQYSGFVPICQSIFAKQCDKCSVFDLVERSVQIRNAHAVRACNI